MNERNLPGLLQQAANRIETNPAPATDMIRNVRTSQMRARNIAVVLAASVAVAVSIGAATNILGRENNPREFAPLTDASTEQHLSTSDLALARRLERDMRSRVRGTYIGGLASILPSERVLSGCGSGRLLVVRAVWGEDANFLHSAAVDLEGQPLAPPDGPMKATFVVVDSKTEEECVRGATFRSVGAAPQEKLLSGVRPSDPTGTFDQLGERAEGADPTLDPASLGRMEVEDRSYSPGDRVNIRWPGEHPRGIAYSLDLWTGENWKTRFYLSAHVGNGDASSDPPWWDADTEGHAWADLGVGGPGPDVAVVPPVAEPGTYRLCTANSPAQSCAMLTVGQT